MKNTLTLSLQASDPDRVFDLLPAIMSLINAKPLEACEVLMPYFEEYPLLAELWNMAFDWWEEDNREKFVQTLGMLGILVAILDSENTGERN